MFILTCMMDHSHKTMSLLYGKESRDRSGLDRIKVRGDKLSYGVSRTSGEQGRCLGERPYRNYRYNLHTLANDMQSNNSKASIGHL